MSVPAPAATDVQVSPGLRHCQLVGSMSPCIFNVLCIHQVFAEMVESVYTTGSRKDCDVQTHCDRGPAACARRKKVAREMIAARNLIMSALAQLLSMARCIYVSPGIDPVTTYNGS